MRDEAVARTYAEALFQASRDADRVDEVLGDIQSLVALLDGSPDFARLLETPAVPASDKKRILEKLLAKDLATQSMNFVKVLVDKGRAGVLRTVGREMVRLVDEHHNRVVAYVVTAVEPSPKVAEALKDRLAKRLGKEVSLDVKVDPSVYGGLMVRVGDTVLDGTIKNRLARLKERMVLAVPGGRA